MIYLFKFFSVIFVLTITAGSGLPTDQQLRKGNSFPTLKENKTNNKIGVKQYPPLNPYNGSVKLIANEEAVKNSPQKSKGIMTSKRTQYRPKRPNSGSALTKTNSNTQQQQKVSSLKGNVTIKKITVGQHPTNIKKVTRYPPKISNGNAKDNKTSNRIPVGPRINPYKANVKLKTNDHGRRHFLPNLKGNTTPNKIAQYSAKNTYNRNATKNMTSNRINVGQTNKPLTLHNASVKLKTITGQARRHSVSNSKGNQTSKKTQYPPNKTNYRSDKFRKNEQTRTNSVSNLRGKKTSNRITNSQFSPKNHYGGTTKPKTNKQTPRYQSPTLQVNKITGGQYPPKNPYKRSGKSKSKANTDEDFEIAIPPETPDDWSSDDDEKIKKNIDFIKRYNLEIFDNITTKGTSKSFHVKYGTDPPRKITNKPTFKDFIEKYEPITVWEQIDRERITSGKNISLQKSMVSLVKGIDYTDELLSLPVVNGNAKLPVQIDGRRFRAGLHNTDQPIKGFNFMHMHQYIIELMKQAIYQARNRMIFMQDLRERHRKAGLYKMGVLFAKADYAGKVFSSVAMKSFRMCSMLRQGIYGIYRPFHHYLDIVYAIERMENKWFDIDLISDMIHNNDNMVKDDILKNKTLQTPKDLVKAFDRMFIE